MPARSLELGLSSTATRVDVVHEAHCPDIGPICEVRDEPPQLHDQQFVVGELRAQVGYGLWDRLGVELHVPLRVNRSRITFRRLDGTPFEPEEGAGPIHHRNETLMGLGDLLLAARPSAALGALGVQGRVGLTLPTGRTEENPFELGRAGLAHQHVQFGTGTFDPVLGVELLHPFGAYALLARGQLQATLYQNPKGFRAGHRVTGGLRGEGPLWARLRGAVGVDVLHERPERWEGRVEQDGNIGRTDVLLGLSLSQPLGGFTASLDAGIPVYQHMLGDGGAEDPGQLRYPVLLQLGLRRRFGAPSP